MDAVCFAFWCVGCRSISCSAFSMPACVSPLLPITEIWVPLNACLLDYDPQPRPSASPVVYKQMPARLVFKRRLYTDLTSPDTMATKLLYYQTLVDICNESLPVSA